MDKNIISYGKYFIKPDIDSHLIYVRLGAFEILVATIHILGYDGDVPISELIARDVVALFLENDRIKLPPSQSGCLSD